MKSFLPEIKKGAGPPLLTSLLTTGLEDLASSIMVENKTEIIKFEKKN